MEKLPYIRQVFYYETDRMGIVHHSNYIRWMEEARLDYMLRCGVDYTLMEAQGILMPVVSVECKYISPSRFGDTIEIETRPTFFNGVRAAFAYKIFVQGGQKLLAEGKSEHCFTGGEKMTPLYLKKFMPDVCEIMQKLVEE